MRERLTKFSAIARLNRAMITSLTLVVSTLLSAVAYAATTLPDPQWATWSYVGDSSNTIFNTGFGAPSGVAGLSASPIPYASASVSSTSDLVSYASLLRYSFSVDSQTTGGLVPISIQYNLTSSSTGDYGRANAWLTTPLFTQILVCSDTNGGGFCGAGYDSSAVGTWTGFVTANTAFGIELYADAIAGQSTTSYAFADPLITVLDSNFTLNLSPGIANGVLTSTPAVPEPSTWVMMLIGLGAAGCSLRRRKSACVSTHMLGSQSMQEANREAPRFLR